MKHSEGTKIVSVTTDSARADAADVIADLRQLIEALDRRVPHLERSGEAQIARDAAELRARAADLIRRIEEGSRDR